MTRPTLRLELNFGTGTYAPGALVLNTGRLDVNVLTSSPLPALILDSPTQGQLGSFSLAADAYGEGFWTDVAAWCESLSIRTGRRRSLEHFSAGRLTAVLDNSDRRFDPLNTDGPYVVAGNTAIVPMRPIRVVAEWGGAAYPLVFTFADGWPVTWQAQVSTTVLTATDAFKVLSDFDPLQVAAVGAGETTGARVSRILDNAGWSATARDIDNGNSTVQATTLATNALGELKLVADTEMGQLFVAPDGRVTFRRRNARYVNQRSLNVQATFGDDPGELPYNDLVLAYDDEIVKNKANIARVGGTAQTAADAESIARNLTHTHTRTDLLMETDTEAADYARTVVARHAENELRFDALVVEPDDDDALWPVALGLRFGDRIVVRRRPPGGGDLIERECFVEGIDHDFAARGRWRTTLHLSDASRFNAFILDYSLLDSEDVLLYGTSEITGAPVVLVTGGYAGGYEGGYGGGY